MCGQLECSNPSSNPFPPGATLHATLGVDFADSTQPLACDVTAAILDSSDDAITEDKTPSLGPFRLTLTPPVGELLTPVSMSVADFSLTQSKLRGLNETKGDAALGENTSMSDVTRRILEAANVTSVVPAAEATDDEEAAAVLRFAGQTCSAKSLVLVTVAALGSDGAEEAQGEEAEATTAKQASVSTFSRRASLSVHCDSVVLASQLLKALQAALLLLQ